MLDSEPKLDDYSINLDIPQSPGTSELPMSPNATGTESSAVVPERTEIVDPQTLPPLAQVTEQPDEYQTELAKIEAEKRRLEEQKRQLERQNEEAKKKELMKQQEEQKKREEALKKQEEQKQEALKKEEERKKREELMRQQAASQQSAPARTERETWVTSGAQKPKPDDTARAVAILEGAPNQKPGQPNQTAQTNAAQPVSYVIQIGAYRDPSMLENLKTKISQLGLTPFTEVSTKDGVQQTRLRVGPFKDRNAAEVGRKKLNSIGLDGIIVSRKS
jgi:DedD protein